MNAIQKALDEAKFRIPRQVLDQVFMTINRRAWQRQPISLDEWMMREVIRPRVLIDCNLVGGTEFFVSLDGLMTERGDDFTTIYRIPKERTQGRSILSVINITFTDPTQLTNIGSTNTQGSSMMLRVAEGIMDAHGAIPIVSSARCQLIGENVVMVRDNTFLPANCFLRVILANDENMSHIQLRSYHHFAKLVELAVKAYIYNHMRIEMAEAVLSGGQSLGVINDVINEFSDSEDVYQDYLREKWTKVAVMNDQESWNRHIRRLVGGHR
jgi:hypothetical protein